MNTPHGKHSAYFCPMCADVESACPKCGMALERSPVAAGPAATIYTCPMHPEIEQDHPGACPICGMALEPKVAVAGGEANPELRDMTRRLWISAALAMPVLLLAMAHMVPGWAHASARQPVDSVPAVDARGVVGRLAVL
jgi:Cu+-exporting ATPase